MTNKLFLSCMLPLLLTLCSCGNKTQEQKAPPIDTIPMLVMQIQKSSRLYTSEYQLHKIVVHSDTMAIKGSFLSKTFKVGLPMGQRKIAIPLTATVKGYIDFGQFSKDNIRRRGDKIEIILPDPELLMTSTRIDHPSIKKKVSLIRSNFSDEEITHYQQQGRQEMIASLPALGIIDHAQQSAARQLIPLIEQMGYRQENITITFRKKFSLADITKLIRKAE